MFTVPEVLAFLDVEGRDTPLLAALPARDLAIISYHVGGARAATRAGAGGDRSSERSASVSTAGGVRLSGDDDDDRDDDDDVSSVASSSLAGVMSEYGSLLGNNEAFAAASSGRSLGGEDTSSEASGGSRRASGPSSATSSTVYVAQVLYGALAWDVEFTYSEARRLYVYLSRRFPSIEEIQDFPGKVVLGNKSARHLDRRRDMLEAWLRIVAHSALLWQTDVVQVCATSFFFFFGGVCPLRLVAILGILCLWSAGNAVQTC